MAVRQLREEKEHELREYKLLSGFRENMSLSTVHTPLNTPEELLASFHKGHRRDIKKATESDLQLIRATDDLREKYYTIWSDMATTKGIHIMSHTHFQQMKEYLQEHDAGDLFCAIDVNGEIVAGSIVAFEENMMTYLYGVKNRADTTTGSHTWLQYQIMIRGYEQ